MTIANVVEGALISMGPPIQETGPKELTTDWKDILCASADTMLDRLERLNRCTGDGVKQKIKTVPAILLDIEC